MEVEYIPTFSTSKPFPDADATRKVVVLCDEESMVTDAATVKRIIHLAFILLTHSVDPILQGMERSASYFERGKDTDERLAWYRGHESVLYRYVSRNTLSSFVHAFEAYCAVLRERASIASRALRVLAYAMTLRPVPGELVEALWQLARRSDRCSIQAVQLEIEMAQHAGAMENELSRKREDWEHNEATSAVCAKALEDWQQRTKAIERAKALLKERHYDELAYEQHYRSAWRKQISVRLVRYAIRLELEPSMITSLEEPSLEDTDIERILADVPPMPERPPWLTSKLGLFLNHTWIISFMVVSIAGTIASIGRMIVTGEFSLRLLSSALSFASYLLCWPRFWKSR